MKEPKINQQGTSGLKIAISLAVVILLVIAAFFGGFFVKDYMRKKADKEAAKKIKTGTLRISSIPEKISVYIDEDKQKQNTPLTLKLKPGVYKILLQSDKYFDWMALVKVSKGQVNDIKAIPVKKPLEITKKKTTKKPAEPEIDLADVMMRKFMFFRTERNWQMARTFLTAKAKGLYSNEVLGGLSSPSYSRYEILDEKKLSDTEAEFTVRIYESMQGKEVDHFDETVKTIKVNNEYFVYEITRK